MMEMWKYSFTFQLGALKADSFSTHGQPSHLNTQRNWVLPCWLVFFFSSCTAQLPASCSFASDWFASLCQHAKAGLASHNQEDLPVPATIILTVLCSSHIMSSLSLHLPLLKSASSIYHVKLGARGKRINAKVRAVSASFLLPTQR